MVTDLSGEDKTSGVKFCTVVYRHPRQGLSLWTVASDHGGIP